MQVIDILNSAARLCGSLAPGETLNASEYTDFFQRLQDMQDSWSTDRMNLFLVSIVPLTAASAKAAYTIGPGATDFNQTRPLLIQTASHILNGITEGLDIVDSVNFASIQDKSTTGKRFLKLYCDYGSPVATLNVWPIPVAAPTFELYAQQPLPTWVTIFDTVALPDGYNKALQYNLAIDIAGDLGTPSDILANIAPIAQQSLQAVRALNQQFLASQFNGPFPNVGSPKTTGTNLAPPTLGGASQMQPIGGVQ